MARKKNAPTAAAYNSAFPRTLRTLMENRVPSVTQSELGKAIGKTRQAVGYYSDGSSSPDWETLVKIADFFSVSVDYLLGRTRIMSPDASLRSASEYTGLSEEAITAFLRMNQLPDRPDLPSFASVLSHLFRDVRFWRGVEAARAYAVDKATAPSDYDDMSFEEFGKKYAAVRREGSSIRSRTNGYLRVAATRDVIDSEYAKAIRFLGEAAEGLVDWMNEQQSKEGE